MALSPEYLRRQQAHHGKRKPHHQDVDSPFTHEPSAATDGRPKDDKGKGGGGDGSNTAVANLQAQARALRYALGKKGLKAALKQQLANVRLEVGQQDAELMRGYGERVASLDAAADDNTEAAAGQTNANLSNKAREQANALSEVAMQGAGETDLLRSSQMALRNWSANQSEVNRAYDDTLTSINSSLADLTADTRTARINNVIQGNADKGQLWTNYYGQVSETETNLGNTLGQLATELDGKKKKGRRKRVAGASADAFMDATHAAGQAWESPGVRARLRNWEGEDPFQAHQNAPQFSDAGAQVVAPEGATLRSWT